MRDFGQCDRWLFHVRGSVNAEQLQDCWGDRGERHLIPDLAWVCRLNPEAAIGVVSAASDSMDAVKELVETDSVAIRQTDDAVVRRRVVNGASHLHSDRFGLLKMEERLRAYS